MQVVRDVAIPVINVDGIVRTARNPMSNTISSCQHINLAIGSLICRFKIDSRVPVVVQCSWCSGSTIVSIDNKDCAVWFLITVEGNTAYDRWGYRVVANRSSFSRVSHHNLVRRVRRSHRMIEN